MAKLTDPCVVYWKHTPEMTSWDQGYIGISGNFEYRMKSHDRDAYLMNSPLEVHHQMRLNEGNVITDIIFEGTRQQCLDMEFELRPRWHIAWNMAAGGMFSNEWKASANWLSQRLWHAEYGEEFISKSYTQNDHAKKYGGVQTNYSGLMRGSYFQVRGWQLQDGQLAQRVWDRCNKPLELSYLIAKGVNIKVYPNGIRDLTIANNVDPKQQGRFKELIRGLRPSAFKHELCTEEEYLANPGPVFGTEE